MGGSFQQGVTNGMSQSRQSYQKSGSNGRPITSSSGKLVNKKKVASQGGIGPNGQIYNMHQSFQAPQTMMLGAENIVNQGQTNAHLINQSLKPKMIVNTNSIPLQPGKAAGMHNMGTNF